MLGEIQLSEIERTTSRLPYGRYEKDAAFAFLENSRKKGRDLCIGTNVIAADAEEKLRFVEDGIFIFSSPIILNTAFLFVKNDAGRSIFGRQKAVYSSYIGELDRDGWITGSIFKNWGIAITSIGNLYRHQGYR